MYSGYWTVDMKTLTKTIKWTTYRKQHIASEMVT